jgi:tRNA threonylcarbamoyladenosine biosynthesis protein TsaB
VQLSIDTASDLASIALSRDGEIVAERAWQCRRNHTQELLVAVDELMREVGVTNAELSAVFVSTGPGMYTGLRVGISTAQGMARALGIPLVGVPRLELDAWPQREFPGAVIAVHRAGRGELAWAVYEACVRVTAPQLSKAAELVQRIEGATMVVGEVDDALREAIGSRAEVVSEPKPRARALAALGNERLRAGGEHEPALVRPVYLRPPAIGPQG